MSRPYMVCELCSEPLAEHEEDICTDCLDDAPDDNPLFGKPPRRLADDMDGDNVE